MITTGHATTQIRRLLNRGARFTALIGAGLAAGATPALASPIFTLSSTNTTGGNWVVTGSGFTPGAVVPILVDGSGRYFSESNAAHATLSAVFYFGGHLQFLPGGYLSAEGPVIVGGLLNGYPEEPLGCGGAYWAYAQLTNGSWVPSNNTLREPACPAIG